MTKILLSVLLALGLNSVAFADDHEAEADMPTAEEGMDMPAEETAPATPPTKTAKKMAKKDVKKNMKKKDKKKKAM